MSVEVRIGPDSMRPSAQRWKIREPSLDISGDPIVDPLEPSSWSDVVVDQNLVPAIPVRVEVVQRRADRVVKDNIRLGTLTDRLVTLRAPLQPVVLVKGKYLTLKP